MMQDTPLIVPMTVDAFLLTKPGSEVPEDIDRRATSLDRLAEHAPMGLALHAVDAAIPGSEGPEHPDDPDDRGIHLQWELPTPLRTGKAKPLPMADGLETTQTGEFPLIPNRWLVTRHAFVTDHSGDSPKQETLRWLIRADSPVPKVRGSGRIETSPAAVLPGPPKDNNTYPSLDHYGIAYPISGETTTPQEPHNWKSSDSPLFLTVNSMGLPEFCSYQPYNKNILSFHDLFADLTHTQAHLNPEGRKKDEITVSYLVVGWYSHQKSDVLNPRTTKLRDVLAGFGWQLHGDDDISVSGTVYVGTVLGVPWKEDLSPSAYHPILENTQPFSLDARPAAGSVGMTVGQTSMEACAAAVARPELLTPEEARLFSAFQHRLLDAPASSELPDHTKETGVFQHALQYGEHSSAFMATQGGRRWRLDNASSTLLEPGQQNVLAGVRKMLDSLNKEQNQYDLKDSECRDLLTRLKGLWWLSMSYNPEDMENPENLKLPEASTAAVRSLKAQLASHVKGRQDLLAKIKNLIEEICRKINAGKLPHRLQPSPMPPFLQATNPVLVMRNLQATRRTIGHDGYLNELLPVRRPAAIPQSPLCDSLRPLLSPPALACITPLVKEFDELVKNIIKHVKRADINCAKFRGSAGTGIIPDAPTTDPYTRWWNQPWKPVFLEWSADLFPSQLKDSPTLPPYTLGTINPTSTDFTPHEPIPQYFHNLMNREHRGIPEDAVRHFSSYFATAQPILEAHTRYRLLHAADLAQEARSSRAYKNLEAKIGKHEWNLTSATLAGVNEACAGRKPDSPLPTRSAALPRSKRDGDLTYTPPPPPEGIQKKEWFETPDPAVVTARTPHLPLSGNEDNTATQKNDLNALGDAYFPPTRSGQLQLTKVVVHDGFGRLLTLLDSGISNRVQVAAPLFVSEMRQNDTRTYTSRSDNEAPDINAAGLVDLRPRLHQGARLRFDYLATGPNPRPLLDLPDPDAANPVHGWLMVTHIGNRHSLLCYSPQGAPLYDLHCRSTSTNARARLLPNCPYSKGPLDDEKFQNDHPVLFSFIKPLLASRNGHGHLAALLSSLDQSLAHTAPPSPSGPDTHSLTLLIGRPVALASARLRLELDGPPLCPPTTKALLAGSGPENVPKWPVSLGSPHLYTDGLLGYYVGTNFKTFHTYYPSKNGAEQNIPYTRMPQYSDVTVSWQGTSGNPAGTDVTLLLCPHNSTYATTDILPATSLQLPPAALDRILNTLQPTVAVGPLLTPPLSPARALRMPIPAPGVGTATWEFAERTTSHELWEYVKASVLNPTDRSPALMTHAHTGYLTLRTQKEDSNEPPQLTNHSDS